MSVVYKPTFYGNSVVAARTHLRQLVITEDVHFKKKEAVAFLPDSSANIKKIAVLPRQQG